MAVKAVIQFHKLTHPPEIATPTAGLAPLAEEGASSEPPPSAPKTAPKTVAASKGQHIASALTYGARVMKDPPTNVFGPGHVVIVAVIQLRDRRWRPPPPPPMRRGGAGAAPYVQPDAPLTGEAAKEAAKLSAFTSLDVAWFEALRPQLCQALKTALHKELNQQTVYKARMADRRAMAIMNVTNSIAREVELDELFPCVVQAGGARRCLTAPPLSRSPFASSAACPARRR